MKLFLIFVTVPIIEIVIFLKVNQFIGLFYTVLLIIATAVIGSLAVKKQGIGILIELQKKPYKMLSSIQNGALILLAGFLLLTPGFITDAIGFALLIPSIRKYLLRKLESQITRYQTD